MCGRLACVLEGNNLSVRCQYTDKSGHIQRPEWESSYHTPGFNLPPTSQIPVLFGKMGQRFFRSMRWGLVPSTHKKSLKDFTLSTHNCCSETIMERPLYSRAFQRGQRCAIPADGFFEWNSTKGAEKIPHFVHRKRDEKSELSGNLLMIAGLYDKCNLENENSTLFSAAVITVNASQSISWLHHRMPALLETEDEVQQWLHAGQLHSKQTLSLLSPRTSIALYPVSKIVNSVSTNGPVCLQEAEPPKKRKVNTLEMFFNKKQKTEGSLITTDVKEEKVFVNREKEKEEISNQANVKK